MTVSKLYEYMSEKVVPESVMPQNITAILADDDEPTIPELDAFTFLNRVRALGIGSADFLYLLKGCNAPESAVEKIENNPAMNLQSLVVTLEESGLTSQDYTRMLYTARQIWERTLTMRIEKVQPAEEQEDDYSDEYENEEEYSDSYEDEQAYEDIPQESEDITEDEADDFDEEPDYDNEADVEESSDPDEDYGEDEVSDSADDEPDDDFEEAEDEADEEDEDEPQPVLTGKQRPKKEYSKNDDFDTYYDADKPVKRHNGKIAASAVGVAVLVGLCVTMDYVGFTPAEISLPTATFAESEEKLFAEIFYAYDNGSGNIGGENVYGFSDSRQQLFGEMLITQPEELGCYTIGSSAFAVCPELITVYGEQDGALITKATIEPPEGARFIDIATSPKQLTAVFASDDSAGFAAYDESGKQLYITTQHGKLTDITIEPESISLGTVYVPKFSESFTVSDNEKYLPLYETDGEIKTIPAESIVSDGESSGCGYAVFGEYSLENGEVISTTAALGDPLYSDSEEFMAIMLTDEGSRLITLDKDGSPELLDVAELIACDMGDVVMTKLPEDAEPYDSTIEFEDIQTVIATAEKDENGELKIFLRGFELKPVSAITGVPEEMTSVYIENGILYICGESGVLNAADISNPEEPRFIEFTEANGAIRDNYALTCDIEDKAVKLTLYKHNDVDKVVEAGSCTRPVSPADGKAAEMCGGNTLFIGDETLAGAAYTYFDGVSMIAEYAVFGKTNTAFTLFDDKDGFTAAVETDGTVHLVYGEDSFTVQK